MKIKFKQGTPKKWSGNYYIVECPDYCPSQMCIATWNGTDWEDDQSNTITQYVTGWQVIDEE